MYDDRDPMKDLTQDMLFEALSQVSKNVYLFKCNVNSNYSIWTKNAISYFGLPDDYQTTFLDFWVKRIHPQDLEEYLEDVNGVFSGKNKYHYCQYRVKNAKDEYIWVECVGSIVVNEETKEKYFVGVVTRLDNTNKYDSVTKCLTANQFYAYNFNKTMGITLIGIDGFKNVVNNYGYVFSNRVLNLLANVLRKFISVDAVYHLSGDKFLLTSSIIDRDVASTLFYNILGEFKKECREQLGLNNMSFTGAAFRYDITSSTSKDNLIKRLERTLQHSKKVNRGDVIFYSKAIELAFVREHQIKTALTRAIANDFKGFELYYQPLVSPYNFSPRCVKSKIALPAVDEVRMNEPQVHAAESLLRFTCDELGMVSPVEFIPYLEESKEIIAVGKWVAEQAIKQCAEWNKINPEIIVGFNVSCLQLCDPDFAASIIHYIKKYKVDPYNIVVELTESYKIEDTEVVVATLNLLRKMHVRVYLDDFGMDHSSFTLVQRLPISGVKVDHSFVRTLTNSGKKEDRVNQAIISSINFMCNKLNLHVVVEGVENQNVYEILLNMGFIIFQGYHFSKPIDVQSFTEKYFTNASE